MRRVRYRVAVSLDGYIAGPKGEADWIIMDPEIDFASIFNQFDTLLVGRGTFEVMLRARNAAIPGMKMFVFSRTLQQSDYPDVTILSENSAKTVSSLRKKPGKDLWLFGGSSLFSSLLNEGLVDTIEVAVIPVLLGGGIPLVLPSAPQTKLKLIGHKLYETTGIVSLEYAIRKPRGKRPPGKR
ncbi:MAG: hypothetical protein QOE77_941 [Blastocatellia bacterium]|jgi:dihydrofolate reductase|nr:hypothetical protein [Blastocatellia bacterium]